MPIFRPLLLTLACLALPGQAPDPGPSFIAAPVRIDLAPLFDAAERATPRVPPGVETWTHLSGPALGGATYRFNLYRDPLQFSLGDGRLSLRTTVNYWLQVGLRMQGWIKGVASCGVAPEPFRRVRLGMQADLGLTPDWGIDLRLSPEEPLRLDACQVTLVGYDITERVLAAMKDSLLKATRTLEQQLRESPLLRQKVENAWLQAQQPVELSPGVFLLLNPEKLRLPPWQSAGQELVLTPEIQVRPSLTLGTPAPQPYRPLPPLDLGPAPAQPGFRLRVQADLSYEQATAQLARQMTGQHFHTDRGDFEVVSIAVRGGGLALLEIGLKGRIDGKLTLAGQPSFDPETGTLSLVGLDYTLESRSWITRLGEWVYRSTLRQTLAEKCNWFMDKSFKDLKRQAQDGLNRNLGAGLALSGTLDGLSLERIQVLDDRFSLVAQLDGKLQIAWKAGS